MAGLCYFVHVRVMFVKVNKECIYTTQREQVRQTVVTCRDIQAVDGAKVNYDLDFLNQ